MSSKQAAIALVLAGAAALLAIAVWILLGAVGLFVQRMGCG